MGKERRGNKSFWYIRRRAPLPKRSREKLEAALRREKRTDPKKSQVPHRGRLTDHFTRVRAMLCGRKEISPSSRIRQYLVRKLLEGDRSGWV